MDDRQVAVGVALGHHPVGEIEADYTEGEDGVGEVVDDPE
jgi:hypothetical protein